MSWNFVKTRVHGLIGDGDAVFANGHGIRVEIHQGAVSLVGAPSAAADRGTSEKVKMWRRRVLLKKGARIHLSILRRADDCSMTVLDPTGVVVCWYGRSGDRERSSAPVLNQHVSQFYVSLDSAKHLAQRHLRAAFCDGISSQEGWRLSAAGDAFWGVTNIQVLTHRDGRLQGFVHTIRPSRGPRESITASVRAPRPMLGQMLEARESLVAMH